jgi:microsomal prostaglandin-E synthase 2
MLGRRGVLLTGGIAGAVSLKRGVISPRVAGCAAASSSAPTAGAENTNITVYQYKICPFCSKVKTYLDYLKVPYDTVEVNPLTKGELGFSKDYKKVPIMMVGPENQQINESDQIIAFITANLKAKETAGASFFPQDTEKWAEWSDKRLAVMLYPNITRSFAESWECFEYVDSVSTWNVANRFVTRAAGTVAMSLANGKIKKKYNIVDERAELKATLAEWTSAVGKKKYLHGDHVTLPDLLVFGVLRSISGLSTFREIMADNADLSAWYGRVDLSLVSMANTSK